MRPVWCAPRRPALTSAMPSVLSEPAVLKDPHRIRTAHRSRPTRATRLHWHEEAPSAPANKRDALALADAVCTRARHMRTQATWRTCSARPRRCAPLGGFKNNQHKKQRRGRNSALTCTLPRTRRALEYPGILPRDGFVKRGREMVPRPTRAICVASKLAFVLEPCPD